IAGAWLGRWLKKTKPVPPEAHAAVRTDLPAPDAAADRDRQSLAARVRSLALRVSHLETEVVRLGGSVAQATVAEPVLRVEPAAAIAVMPAPVAEPVPIAPEPVPAPAPASSAA